MCAYTVRLNDHETTYICIGEAPAGEIAAGADRAHPSVEHRGVDGVVR